MIKGKPPCHIWTLCLLDRRKLYILFLDRRKLYILFSGLTKTLHSVFWTDENFTFIFSTSSRHMKKWSFCRPELPKLDILHSDLRTILHYIFWTNDNSRFCLLTWVRKTLQYVLCTLPLLILVLTVTDKQVYMKYQRYLTGDWTSLQDHHPRWRILRPSCPWPFPASASVCLSDLSAEYSALVVSYPRNSQRLWTPSPRHRSPL